MFWPLFKEKEKNGQPSFSGGCWKLLSPQKKWCPLWKSKWRSSPFKPVQARSKKSLSMLSFSRGIDSWFPFLVTLRSFLQWAWFEELKVWSTAKSLPSPPNAPEFKQRKEGGTFFNPQKEKKQLDPFFRTLSFPLFLPQGIFLPSLSFKIFCFSIIKIFTETQQFSQSLLAVCSSLLKQSGAACWENCCNSLGKLLQIS